MAERKTFAEDCSSHAAGVSWCSTGTVGTLAAELRRFRFATVAGGHHYRASMAMTQREIEGQYAYGWRFGLGFGAATSICAIVWIVISIAVTNVIVDEQIRQISAVTNSITSSMKQPKAKTSRVVQIAAENKEVCFERTNGVINEAFQRCLTGYSMTVTD